MTDKLNLVDNLFESYNYKIAKNSTKDVRIYTLQYGMYHAAEIISFDEKTDVTQFKNEFVPWLSIIDILMFNSPEHISTLLNDYELV